MKRKTKIRLLVLFLFIDLIVYVFIGISPIYSQKLEGEVGKNEVFVTGHRGAGGLAPENTLASIQKGLDLKVKRMEIDVHQTKDNEVILMHDKTIERTTNGQGEIKELTIDELNKYKIEIVNFPEFKNEKIPTLSEALELIDGKAELLIEIKYGDDYYKGIEENVLAIINKHNAKNWCLITAFDGDILRKVNSLDNEIRLQKLFIGKLPFLPFWIGNTLEYVDSETYDFVSDFNIYYVFTTREAIRKTHEFGKKINIWTVNDVEKIMKLTNLGVDGIITDFPNYQSISSEE